MVSARGLKRAWQHDRMNVQILPDNQVGFKKKIMYYQIFTAFDSI
jgi:hypothetical protein